MQPPGLLDEPRDRLGDFVHVDRLDELRAAARQADDGQARERREERGALAARAVHQRRPQHGAVERQRGQRFVGQELAVQVRPLEARRIAADTERGDLHDALHAGHRGAAEQLDGSLGVHAPEGLSARGHQDADAVHHRVDACVRERIGPHARLAWLHVVDVQRGAAVGGGARAFDHVVASRAQGMRGGAADAAGGAADEDSHDEALTPAFSRSRESGTLHAPPAQVCMRSAMRRALASRTSAISGAAAREIAWRWRANTR